MTRTDTIGPSGTFTDSVTYHYDFYSGANIGIWISDVLIATAIGIEFSVIQTKRPVYGWASQLYDGVAGGIVQVSGSLYMNFRQAHEFTSIIDHYSRVPSGAGSAFIPVFNDNQMANYVTSLTNNQIDLLQDRVWGKKESSGNPAPEDIKSWAQSIRRPDAHANGVDIMITYGDYMTDIPAPNSTMRRIYNAHITGFGQSLEDDGRPVVEAYNFLARQVL